MSMVQTVRRRGGGGRARGNGTARTLPAPVGGLNSRDGLASMDPRFATVLDNWFPRNSFVELRNGSAEHANGLGDDDVVETLFVYRALDIEKMLGICGGSIFDATIGGTVGSALKTGLAGNRWTGVNFNGKGLFFNGEDDPLSYDGTAITDAGFTGTGLTVSNLFAAHPYKSRLLILEKDTANIWYGDILGVTGALTKFPLGSVHPGGGKCLALGTLTLDGGAGIDDRLCIFMSSGDVLVYGGTNISDSDSFGLQGIFHMGRVVGDKPLVKIGADLMAITTDGYVPVADFLAKGRSQRNYAISNAIVGDATTAIQNYSKVPGWQSILYPRGDMLIFNVPIVAGRLSYQHVMNTQTGAWARFKGWNAACWVLFDDEIYFGADGGKVIQADVGQNDAGARIMASAQTAYSYFGSPATIKHFRLYRPILETDASPAVRMGLGVDFEKVELDAVASGGEAPGVAWDEGVWDVAEWAGGARVILKEWQSATGQGTAASVALQTETRDASIKWFSTDIVFESGGAFI